jgi:hypothetical protein
VALDLFLLDLFLQDLCQLRSVQFLVERGLHVFDRLNHELLFNKLYHDGICGDLWILLRNMYREVSVKVKWDNNLSKKVDVACNF